MRDKNARREIEQHRHAIVKLAQMLGISADYEPSYRDFGGTLDIGKYEYTYGGNPKKRPISTELFETWKSEFQKPGSDLRMLMDYLGLKFADDRRIVPVIKPKSKKSHVTR